MEGSCVERNKTSHLTALILYLALVNETGEYNSRRGKNPERNCDTGCKTVWSGVLKYTMEDLWGSFYKDFHRNDIIHTHAMSLLMSLESCDLKCYHLTQNI